MKNALLVVDVQNFFLQDAPADLPQNIVNHHNALGYDEIIFVTFKNTPDSNFVRSLKWTKCSSDEDAGLPKVFAKLANDKNTFTRNTYSAFNGTQLQQYLQSKNVERLVICGVDTDACVLATAFDAFDHGYHVKVEFSLTFSGNDLQQAAEDIIRKTISSRD